MLLNSILILEKVQWLDCLAYLLPIIIPLAFVLLVARFRSFFASIFFLPFIHGLLIFLLSISKVVNFITSKMGSFGSSLIKGIELSCTPFSIFHSVIVDSILNTLINNKTCNDIFSSNWFMFVPYLILFIIFFVIFKKRKRKKEADYF